MVQTSLLFHSCALAHGRRYGLLHVLRYLLPLCGPAELLAHTASGWSPLTTACRSKQSPCVVAVLQRAKELQLHDNPEVAEVRAGLAAGGIALMEPELAVCGSGKWRALDPFCTTTSMRVC